MEDTTNEYSQEEFQTDPFSPDTNIDDSVPISADLGDPATAQIFSNNRAPTVNEPNTDGFQERFADLNISNVHQPNNRLQHNHFPEAHPRNLFPRTSSRKDLPKIEYSRLVVLSLSNFQQFKESIKVVGYARGWPRRFACPTFADLEFCQDIEGPDEAACEKEAYLVIYQMIPLSLKYLISEIENGDVVSVWKALYQRFLQVTDIALKVMKQEWESLSMVRENSSLDEFISLVSQKAINLRMVGQHVSKKEEATALLCGLSPPFDWLRSFYSVKSDYDFSEISNEAMKFAVDKGFFATRSTSSKASSAIQPNCNSEARPNNKFCLGYNKGTCKRTNCRFPHIKVSTDEIAAFENRRREIKEPTERKTPPFVGSVNDGSSRDKKFCFKCYDPSHLADVCPHKDKIQEFIKGLKTPNSSLVSSNIPQLKGFSLPVFLHKFESNEWILDGGASQHITRNFSCLQEAVNVPADSILFTVGNDQIMSPSHVGNVVLGAVTLTNVYYCEDCPVNLISEARLLSSGADVVKRSLQGAAVVVKDNVPIIFAPMKDNLFVVTLAHNGTDGLGPL
jgi:hypothetical protein